MIPNRYLPGITGKNNDQVYENVIAYLSAGNCVFIKASGLLRHIRRFPSTRAVVRFM
jgi:hypothetical protein